MYARQLAEIGSWTATFSGTLVFGEPPQSTLAASQYWTASKCRIQRWVTALKMFQHDFHGEQTNHDPWPAFEVVVEEIVVSEMLTRIWSAVVSTHDWYHQNDELHGLAHSINVAHIEAKNRALRLMLSNRAANEKVFDRVNVLRRKVESWTDLFLGHLPRTEHPQRFGFQPSRVSDFSLENRHYSNRESSTRQQVLVASLAQDLRSSAKSTPANPTLNRKIASGVLACFPGDRFDSTGLPKSARMIWLEKTQEDTQQLLDQLLDFERDSAEQSVSDFDG